MGDQLESVLSWQQALIQALEPTVDAATAGGAAEGEHAGNGHASPKPAQQVCNGMAHCCVMQPQARCVCPLQQVWPTRLHHGSAQVVLCLNLSCVTRF